MRLGIGLGLFKSGALSVGLRIFSAYKSRVIGDGGTVEAASCVVNGINSSAILQSASLLLIPSGYKSGVAYSEIPTNGIGDLTWSRAGTGTRTNASGNIEEVAWNLLTYSEEFDNAFWNKTNLTISANSTTAPNGTSTADKLVENVGAGSKNALSTSIASVVGTTYTSSVYVKAGERNWVLVIYFDNTTVKGRFFNLSDGSGGSYWASAAITNTITNVGDGWYRISLTYAATSTSNILGVYLASADNIVNYTGNGTNGLFVWGAQINIGTDAKTYLPVGSTRNNYPRLSYMYGSCPALLAEPQRTNLCLQSNTFTLWQIFGGATITANSTTSPDGATNATTLNSAGGANDFLYQSFTVTNATTYTVSFFVKNNNSTQSKFYIPLAASPEAFINWSGSTITSVTSSGTSNTFTALSNGWYRVAITATATATGTYIFRIYSDNNNTSKSIYIFGAQLEAGAYPTTYIPTTTASATRVADSASKTGISSLIGQSEGVVFADFVVNGRTQNVNILNGEKNTTASFFLGARTDGAIDAGLYASSSPVGRITAGSVSVGQRAKVAYAYKSGNSALYINGVQVGTSSGTFTLPSTLDDLFLNDPTTYFNYQESVSFNQVALFTTRLTNAQLETLTT